MTKLRLLFVTPYLPSPPRSGGPRRLHGLITGLARSHDVSVLSLVEPGDEIADAVRATREYCAEVVTVDNPRYGLAGRGKRLLQLGSLLTPLSYERLVYHRPALQARMDHLLARRHFDIITVEFAQMAPYRFTGAGGRNATKLVLDEHNIEYDILYRTYEAGSVGPRKLYNYADYLKLRREERRAWRRFDGCTLTSARDEALLRRDCPRLPTAVVPNAVDVEFFRPAPAAPEPATVLFFGAIDYYPNTDGLLFFLDEVWPQLRARYPALTLRIVGPSPPEAITRRAGPDIVVTGFVPDVRVELERATVAIAPLRVGGGTRLKIVEAMAMGKAIVSTTIGAEGIDVTAEEDILLADEPGAFADQVGRALDDAALRRRLGVAARRLVERRYSWAASVEKLEGFYRRLLAGEARPLIAGGPGRAAAAPGTRAG